MTNVNSAIPSFIILTMFLAYFFSVPRIPVLTNRLFIKLLVFNFLASAFNLLASDANSRVAFYSVTLTYIFDALFFIFLVIRSYLFFAYTASLVNMNRYNYKFISFISRIPLVLTVIMTVSSVKTGAVFSVNAAGYMNGPFIYLLFACQFFYHFLSLMTLLIHSYSFNSKKDFYGAVSYVIMIFLGTVFVVFSPTSLLIDTFCLMALMVIYLLFENAEFRTEKRTGLFNLNALHEYLDEIKYKKKHLLLAFVIKNYHDIRDIYGTPQIDNAIRLIGQYLKTTFPGILSFYLKEGRFILAASEDTDPAVVCDKIRDRFSKVWNTKEADLYLNICFAKMSPDASIQTSELTINSLLSALHRSSMSDDGYCATVEAKDISDYVKEISVKKILEISVEENLVEVFLQPIVETKNLRIVGAEALARIRDHEGNYISPGDFIPIAEKNGCITALGEQILDKTCRFIKENALDSIGLSWVNVNLSPIQFFMKDIAASYDEIIKRNGLDYNIIHLEITEEAMVSHNLLMKQMESMQEKGFRFVLDDYGKGYSNLSRLHKCPFINIKIDMELVWSYCNNPNLLLPSMISSFKSMGFTITAEGIENKEMADAMIELGCDYLQGYYFSKPLSMNDFANAFAIFA